MPDTDGIPSNNQPNSRKQSGIRAEEAVAKRLEEDGYAILDRNFSVPRIGELDIVAIRGDAVHFIEVRARRQGSTFGTGAESITAAKMRKMRNAAAIYLSRKRLLNNDVYLLAADVALDARGNVLSIHIISM
jgi:putative endonuclease